MHLDYSQLPRSPRNYNLQLLIWATVLIALTIYGLTIIGYSKDLGWSENAYLLAIAGFVAIIFGASAAADRLHQRAVKKFAIANALTPCEEAVARASVPEPLKNIGSSRKIRNAYQLTLDNKSGLSANVFEYSYKVQEGRTSKRYHYTVATMQLKNRFPHLFLDSLQNGLENYFTEAQHIQLEGNFDRHFKLYSPEAANIEALQIMNPDIMQALITDGASYDIDLQRSQLTLIGAGQLYSKDTFPHFIEFADSLSSYLSEKKVKWQPPVSQLSERAKAVSELRSKSWIERNRWVIIAVFIWLAYQLYEIVAK